MTDAPGTQEAQWLLLWQLVHVNERKRKICYCPRTGGVWIGSPRFDSLDDAIRYLVPEPGTQVVADCPLHGKDAPADDEQYFGLDEWDLQA